jgi:hypothetical protein
MSAIFSLPNDAKYPIRIVNVRTLGACCGRYRTYEDAEQHLKNMGYSSTDYWRENNTVCYRGEINC